MKCEVINHRLFLGDEPVPFRESPNHGGLMQHPILIVIHYTGDNSATGAISWLTDPSSKVSAHLVIDKDGSITQLLPFNVKGWHAGSSSWNGMLYVNSFSVGIENVGLGDEWPDPQVEANRAVIAALFDAYPIQDVVGHSDVAPGRKVDPGPNYPWDQVTI